MGCRKLNATSWTWVAAAARGTAHARMDARLQDAYKCCFIENSGNLFAIVSDGAGSAIRGGEGASLSCRTLSSLVRTHYEHNRFAPSDEIIHSWIDIVRARIDEAALSRGLKYETSRRRLFARFHMKADRRSFTLAMDARSTKL